MVIYDMRISIVVMLAIVASKGSTFAAAPTSAPVPSQLLNGKDLGGWIWYHRPPRTATAPAAVSIDQVWSVKDRILHTSDRAAI
jgi:hypothetical protein